MINIATAWFCSDWCLYTDEAMFSRTEIVWAIVLGVFKCGFQCFCHLCSWAPFLAPFAKSGWWDGSACATFTPHTSQTWLRDLAIVLIPASRSWVVVNIALFISCWINRHSRVRYPETECCTLWHRQARFLRRVIGVSGDVEGVNSNRSRISPRTLHTRLNSTDRRDADGK